MRPASMTMISSASATVDSLWAIKIVVLPLRSSLSCSMRRPSVPTSRALVTSSHMRISGSLSNARPIVALCLCPPESLEPLSPTAVW
mmetsp:Transcript_26536/g.51397  ORF Transcript_26536/g.51397 Transcript_26536/m.51397 type:complete len:87 (+) Transcript_26536:165-425(+)